MKYEFLDSLNLEPGARSRISQFLSSIESGSDVPLRSPFASFMSSESILSAWDGIYNSNSDKLNVELKAIENSNRRKYGPRSLAIPWGDRFEGVLEYFSPQEKTSVPAYQVSFPRRLRPLGILKAADYLKSNTNSGLPFVARKKDVKLKVITNFSRLLERNDPCVLFTRTQESNKTRNVWGYPIADTLNEMRYYRPFLEHQRRLNWRAALLGPAAVDTAVTDLIKSAMRRKLNLVSLDFSSYDASVKFKLQECSFRYIKSHFQLSYSDEIDDIFYRFNTIPLITPSGILNGPHGVPSGSTFTNEVDSITQYLCAKDFGLSDLDMNIQGDDGVYCTQDAESLFNHFERYGLKISKEKSLVSSNSVVFLQNYHSPDYTNDEGLFAGIYSTYRALGRIVFPERYDQFSDYRIRGADFYSIRTISILENCSNHPLFEELVRFVASIDKYSLKYSQRGLKKYCQYLLNSQGSDEIRRYRRGIDVSGIENFKTVQLLSKL